jgi:hypothetical protein
MLLFFAEPIDIVSRSRSFSKFRFPQARMTQRPKKLLRQVRACPEPPRLATSRDSSSNKSGVRLLFPNTGQLLHERGQEPDGKRAGRLAQKTSSICAYMLRLRQVSSDGEPIWRTSLESPHIGERLGFGSLEELFDFL